MGGDLIALTGLDGSGKSLQSKLLVKKLNNYKLVWARYDPFLLKLFISIFNTFTLKNRKIDKITYNKYVTYKQKLFKNKLLKEIYFLLSFVDYYTKLLFKVNIPSFLGKNIILDRYYYDYIVDLTINFNLIDEDIKKFCDRNIFKLFKKARVSLLLDIPADTTLKRKDDMNVPNKDYLIERREKYLTVAKALNIKIIDATKSVEDIHKRILEVIK